MRKRAMWCFGITGCVGLWLALEFGGIKRPYFTQTCINCLESERVRETRVFGLVVHRRKWVSKSNDLMAPGAQAVPTTGGADLYREIWGSLCSHRFKKGGFCRRTGWLLFGVVGCGSYAEGLRYKASNTRVVDVFEAYRRIGSKDLVRRTHSLIFDGDARTFTPKNWPLDHFETETEWSKWLEEAQADPHFDLSRAP